MFVYKLFLLLISASTSCAYINNKDPSLKQLELPTIQIPKPKNTQVRQKAASRYVTKDALVEKKKQVVKEHPRATKTIHKRWGVDAHGEEYWYDQRIHTLGNVGFGGAVHAACAAVSTKLIDIVAYDGMNVRQKVRHTNDDAMCVCMFFSPIRCQKTHQQCMAVPSSFLTFHHPRWRGNWRCN
jgi:hypothetical protein